jgi:hypothetical protein
MRIKYTAVDNRKTSLDTSIILRMRICVLFVNSCTFPSRKTPVKRRMHVNRKPVRRPITTTNHRLRYFMEEVYFKAAV